MRNRAATFSGKAGHQGPAVKHRAAGCRWHTCSRLPRRPLDAYRQHVSTRLTDLEAPDPWQNVIADIISQADFTKWRFQPTASHRSWLPTLLAAAERG